MGNLKSWKFQKHAEITMLLSNLQVNEEIERED
jgi:hypothetical protein